MELEKTKLIQDPFDLEILSLIDGKNNITAVSKQIGYTYKSVFHRIKKLESKGFIVSHKTKDITEGVLFSINPKFHNEIKGDLGKYNLSKGVLEESLKNESLKKDIYNLLDFINRNRFISEDQLMSYILEQKNFDKLAMLFYPLQICNWIKMRTEITRKGKKILELLKNSKS